MSQDISTLGIAVDSSDVRQATGELDKLAQQGGKTEGAMQRLVRAAREFGSGFRAGAREGMREFTTGTQGVATASRNAQSSMDRLTRSARDQSAAFSSAAVVLRRFVPMLAAFFSANAIIKTTDAYTSLNARLLLATGSSEKFAIAQAKLSDIAHRSRAGIEETSDLFAKLALATGELGVSQTELLGVTETINQAMQVSGASAQESAGALRQLGQAFASGVLRGEELNSVMEQAPRLARAIADGMGVSIGALRQMGAEGQLTGERVFKALQKSGQTVAQEFSKLPLTVGGASTQVKNALFELVGSFTSGVGASTALAEAISDVADGIREVAKQVPNAIKWISDLIEQFRVGKEAAGGFWSALFRYGTEFREPDKAIAETTREIEKLQEQIRRDERAMAGDGFRGLNSRKAAEERNKARREEIAQLERDLKYYRLLSRQQIPGEIHNAMDALGGTGAAATGGGKPRTAGTDPKEAANLRKAMMDAETAAIRRGLAEWTSAYAASETILEAQRSAGLVSEQDYYNRKRRLIEDTAQTQVRALQEENKLIAAQNVSGPERIKALSQIADNETKISDIRRQAMVQVEILGMRQEAANKAAARSFEEARFAAQNYLDTLVQQQRREVEMMGMGERARERQAGLNQIDDSYQSQRQELENNRALLQMEGKWTEESQSQYRQRLAIINDYHAKARESYENFWRLRSARETDGLLGMAEGLRNYADEANNIYAQMGDAVTNALQGMEDALVEFTMTGKADFRSLVDSIIADLARIQIKKALGSIAEGLGGGDGIGAIFASIFKANADGNVYNSPSLSRYSGGVYNTPQFFAFAKGAGVFAEAGPEAIMPLKRGKDGKLGVQATGGGVTINPTYNFATGMNTAEAVAMIEANNEQLKADIAESLQRGRMVTA